MAPGHATIEVAGISINLARQGSGRKLLYLHGANGATEWLPFFETLSAKFDVLVPDHPAFGQSDTPNWIRSVPDLAMFYLDFLEKLDLQEVHVVGSSLGGWIAAEIATRNAARLSSLSLISPAGIRIKGVPLGDLFIWAPEERARKLYFDQAVLDRVLSAKPSEEEIDLQTKNGIAAAKYCWQPRLYDPDLEKWLHRINIPTQIIWGANDQIIPPQYGNQWQRQITGSRLTIIDKCGHLPHVEAPDELVGHLESFLEGVTT